jgi:hypothetical protein
VTWDDGFSRTFLSIVGGIVAGVLGLTAISGFLFYFLMMILVSAAIAVKANFNVFTYFDSWQRITLDGITAGFMVSVVFPFPFEVKHLKFLANIPLRLLRVTFRQSSVTFCLKEFLLVDSSKIICYLLTSLIIFNRGTHLGAQSVGNMAQTTSVTKN